MASGPVVLPPLSQGIVGKMRGRSNLDVPLEVLVEPVGIGTPGAYVAQVASRIYSREEIDGSGDNCHYRPVQATLPGIVSLRY